MKPGEIHRERILAVALASRFTDIGNPRDDDFGRIWGRAADPSRFDWLRHSGRDVPEETSTSA